MTKRVTVRPVEGRRVRIPDTGAVLTAEKEVPLTSYWLRRIEAGDVEMVEGGN